MDKHRVAFVLFDGFQTLDLAGPWEVFRCAGSLTGGYTCRTVARSAGPVPTGSGLPVHAGHGIGGAGGADPGEVDTLVVVGGDGVGRACEDEALVRWVAAAGVRAGRVTSVCSGAFLLAAAGLVAGRRVTTHWRRAEELARAHPEVEVDADPVFIRDGRVWTSAGVTAGMDLALALVERDHGRRVAHEVAREMVLFLRRPGSQSQFSVPLWSRQPSSDPIGEAVASVHARLDARHTVESLAERAGLSPRQLQRRFAAELEVGPGEFVERVRVEAAQRALAEGADPVEAVARRCGFGTAETLRRAFHRRVGVAPSEYRERFRSMREYA